MGNGLNGQPAVRELERNYHAKWRSTPTERKFFQRRMYIISYIAREYRERMQRGDEDLDILDVVQAMDDRCARENMSINQLSHKISTNQF
jgi:Transcriptional activator of glycolytic enzymes